VSSAVDGKGKCRALARICEACFLLLRACDSYELAAVKVAEKGAQGRATCGVVKQWKVVKNTRRGVRDRRVKYEIGRGTRSWSISRASSPLEIARH